MGVGWIAIAAALTYALSAFGALIAQSLAMRSAFNVMGKFPVQRTMSLKSLIIACLGISETLAIYGFVIALILIKLV